MKQDKEAWQELNRTLIARARVFELWSKRMLYPGGEDDFYFLDTLDYVNIVPVTAKKEVVLVRQYRHGVDESNLELPGGMVDSRAEDPKSAAVRELEEETGYRASDLIPLGAIHPNPAIQNNSCHVFFAPDAAPTGKQNLDSSEDITVHLFPLAQIPELIYSGKITHALIVASLLLFALKHGERYGVTSSFG